MLGGSFFRVSDAACSNIICHEFEVGSTSPLSELGFFGLGHGNRIFGVKQSCCIKVPFVSDLVLEVLLDLLPNLLPVLAFL